MAQKSGSYAGRIAHAGAQKVEAPFQPVKQSKAVVKKGDDLRAGEGKRKQK